MVFNIEAIKYIPIFKTRDAEIKGYDFLHDDLKKMSMPIVELTRGRKSVKDKVGKIEKRIKKIQQIFEEKPFILDITGSEKHLNEELESLLDPNDGFNNWCNYLTELKEDFSLNIIPIIHLSGDKEDKNDVVNQFQKLNENHEYVAIRLFINEAKATIIIDDLMKELSTLSIDVSKTIFILDCEYVKQGYLSNYQSHVHTLMNHFVPYAFHSYVILSSSYPDSIASTCNNDEHSILPSQEKILSDYIKNNFSEKIIHGDYCSIHPEIKDGFATKPVPRIEFIYGDKYFYYRKRNDVNAIAYKEIASQIVSQPEFLHLPDCWGTRRIEDASRGEVFARNAASWISVRMNIFMTTVLSRL